MDGGKGDIILAFDMRSKRDMVEYTELTLLDLSQGH